MRLPHWRNAPVMLAAGFTLLSVVALGLALSWRSADQQRLEEGRFVNCQAIEALKTLQRQALSEEIVSSKKFLREHPDGIPGIPPELIEDGIFRDIRARDNLAPVEC